jgi:hypothetical protein
MALRVVYIAEVVTLTIFAALQPLLVRSAPARGKLATIAALSPAVGGAWCLLDRGEPIPT